MKKALDIPWVEAQSYSTSGWLAAQLDAQLIKKENRTRLEVCCKHPKDTLDASCPLHRTAPTLLPYTFNQTYHLPPAQPQPTEHHCIIPETDT